MSTVLTRDESSKEEDEWEHEVEGEPTGQGTLGKLGILHAL